MKKPRIVYVFNSHEKLMNEGTVKKIAKKYALPVTTMYYKIETCGKHGRYYFSWDKHFKPKLIERNKTLDARRERAKSTKELLRIYKIKKLRLKKGISREHLATILNSSLNVIWDLESIPFHNPQISILMKLAKYYNVKMEELVNMDAFKFVKIKTLK